jgi:DNA-binding response OmpR family regulator
VGAGWDMRLLIVEDDRTLAASLKRALAHDSYAVDAAYDGEEGEELAGSIPYDLIVLDIVLPNKNGIEVCRSLRRRKVTSRILMLTNKSEVSDRVTGLDAGADDYLPKPFRIEELLARVRALLRRDTTGGSTVVKVGDISLDTVTRQVKRGDMDIPLNPREYAILHYLMIHAGTVVTRAMIEEHVWDISLESGSHLLEVYINRIRNKVGDKDRSIIETKRGLGYRLDLKD